MGTTAGQYPPLSCRTSPPQGIRKGGDRLSSRLSQIFNAAGDGAAFKQPISPLAGEMSGRTEGGVKERRLLRDRHKKSG
ncbi:hypothetical protein EH240_34590 [Mesorhizobium tamadayense]|uniref:Propionyl-coenzyme A carboxylase alpha polypeptide n=1 Tax=Mesorhizobium tamadayense TaxID=425306 RepID=A0A3P3ER70_9HYPH|nr:hypothetical protein EH240_34590 [Mesorhizobium tamadayense]